MGLSIRRKLPGKFNGYVFLTAIWLLTGFALGSFFLLWPLRMWVNYVRDNSYTETTEKVGVVVLILLLVIISFRISLSLFHWHTTRKKTITTILAIVLPLISSACALYLFMNPDIVNNGTEQSTVTQRFTTGPYPTEQKIRALRREGYTSVISLLHPAVVPFEPELLNQEEALLKKYHMELIRAPMLPWITDNTASLKIIENVVKNGKGKYYIHCYLGKDRVNVVKNLILKLADSTAGKPSETSRSFEGSGSLERGDIYKIDSLVYMCPFPTDEEFLAYFLAGHTRTVVDLMDSTQKENKPWLQKESNALQPNGIIFRNFAITATSTAQDVENIIDSIMLLPRPIVVHHWNTVCPESRFFRKVYFGKTHYTQMNLATHATETF